MPPKKDKGHKKDGDDTTGNTAHICETPPKDISMTDLWNLMYAIKKDTETANAKLSRMETRVTAVESTNQEIESKILDVETDVASLKDTVKLLSGRLIRSETKNTRFQHELSDLKSRSMNQNLIFNFDRKTDIGKENREEDCEDIVRKFLTEEMKITSDKKFSITAAHRLGAYTDKGRRPIIAKFPISSEIETIMSHVRSLKGTRHFVNRQLPPDKSERKQFTMTEFAEKKKVGNAKVRMVNENLFVNGSLQRKFLLPTLPSGLDQSSEESIVEEDIAESDSIEDNGSTFKGYVTDVASLDDVRATLDLLVRRPEVAAATHVIYAYRFHVDDDPEKDLVENFDSDGDHGVGLKLLRAMQDKEVVSRLFVVTRKCNPDFAHIGQRRFQHAIEVCFSLLSE